MQITESHKTMNCQFDFELPRTKACWETISVMTHILRTKNARTLVKQNFRGINLTFPDGSS